MRPKKMGGFSDHMIECEMLDEIEEFLDEKKVEMYNIVVERFGGDWNAAANSGELNDLCDEHTDLRLRQ